MKGYGQFDKQNQKTVLSVVNKSRTREVIISFRQLNHSSNTKRKHEQPRINDKSFMVKLNCAGYMYVQVSIYEKASLIYNQILWI